MPFQVSPGVNVSEIDLTTIIPQIATTSAGFVGDFQWGPCNTRTLISNENKLREIFGTPDNDHYIDWFSAANFLQYGNNLQVVRARKADAKNANCLSAGEPSTGTLIDSREHFEGGSAGTAPADATDQGLFAAKYPGELGNSIALSIFDSAVSEASGASFGNWGSINLYSAAAGGKTGDFFSLFDERPGISDFGGVKSGNTSDLNDEIHLVVYDSLGKWTGTRNKPLEVWPNLSKASDARLSDGRSNYYKDVLNDRSKYVWVTGETPSALGTGATNGVNWGTAYGDLAGGTYGSAVAHGTSGGAQWYVLAGGLAGAPVDGDYITGYRKFKDSESVDVSLLIGGGRSATVANELVDIAEFRKDCISFISPESSDVVGQPGAELTNTIAFRDSITTKSTYAVMDCGWKYMYDVYNDVYRYVPLSPDVAGCCVRTDSIADPWFSPAGFTRGKIRNIIKLAWNPDKLGRDELYKKGVNPVCSFEGEGIVLFGDKTMSAKPSAFDRINVRRLFIVLEKAIATASKFSLFEFNDAFTRSQFKNLVTPFLRDVQSRRGIFDFKVVCDDSNNTAEVIDGNEFVADIYIKPARSINFIQLNFIATRTGIDFDEIGG